MKKTIILITILICGAALTSCTSSDSSKLEEKLDKLEKNITSLTEKINELEAVDVAAEEEEAKKKEFEERQASIDKKNAEAKKILEGKIKVPDTARKSQEQVEAEFEAAGLKVKFVPTNMDNSAVSGKRIVYKGECDYLNESSGAEYYGSDQVGLSNQGYYAKKGDTIIVGYSDHEIDGTSGSITNTSSSEKEQNSSSSETSAKASSSSVLGVSDSEIEAIKTYKDYLNMYSKIITNFLSEYEGVFKDTVLYDESAFAEMKKEYQSALDEQKKQYEDLGTKDLVGKDTMVKYLKSYRDGLSSYIDGMKGALN